MGSSRSPALIGDCLLVSAMAMGGLDRLCHMIGDEPDSLNFVRSGTPGGQVIDRECANHSAVATEDRGRPGGPQSVLQRQVPTVFPERVGRDVGDVNSASGE